VNGPLWTCRCDSRHIVAWLMCGPFHRSCFGFIDADGCESRSGLQRNREDRLGMEGPSIVQIILRIVPMLSISSISSTSSTVKMVLLGHVDMIVNTPSPRSCVAPTTKAVAASSTPTDANRVHAPTRIKKIALGPPPENGEQPCIIFSFQHGCFLDVDVNK
jgi:hypothetical protein